MKACLVRQAHFPVEEATLMARPVDFSAMDEYALEKLDDNFSRMLELGNPQQQGAARKALSALQAERQARRARILARRAVAAGFS